MSELDEDWINKEDEIEEELSKLEALHQLEEKTIQILLEVQEKIREENDNNQTSTTRPINDVNGQPPQTSSGRPSQTDGTLDTRDVLNLTVYWLPLLSDKQKTFHTKRGGRLRWIRR